MKVCHTLIFFFFFLTLQDGNIGLINAKTFTGTEGQSITVLCTFPNKGNWRFFCKDQCEEKILEMYDERLQRGRYSMKYKNTRTGSRLDVTITQLTKSDSGRYGCGLDKFLSKDPYIEFEIIVKDAPSTSKPASTPPPPTTTTTQSFRRSSTPSSSSAETINQSEEQQPEITDGSSGVLLYVGLTLLITALLFSVAVLIFKKRATKPKEHPVETEYANVTETEDDSSELFYTRGDFSNSAAASLISAPRGHADDDVYSTALYSTVNFTSAVASILFTASVANR